MAGIRLQKSDIPNKLTYCDVAECVYNNTGICDDPRNNKGNSDAKCFRMSNKALLKHISTERIRYFCPPCDRETDSVLGWERITETRESGTVVYYICPSCASKMKRKRVKMKYNLEQLIWYMSEGNMCNAKVLARTTVENAHEDWASTKEQKSLFTPFGVAGVFYATTHGIFKQEEVFASKAELIEFLAKE